MTGQITCTNGELKVPENPTVLYIEGDGIGKDIWDTARTVFDAAMVRAYGRGGRSINWVEVLAGEKAYAQTGEWLPTETVDAIRKNLVALKGPLGTPTGGGHRSLNVTLRQELDLYACVRPVRYFAGVPTPVKHPENVDLVIFRENTEDIYAGIEWDAGTLGALSLIYLLTNEMNMKNIRFPKTTSIGIKPISEEGSKRLVRAAIEHALVTGRKNVTIVHKGNIQKYTEGGFLRWGRQVAEEEYADAIKTGSLVINDMIADNFFQQVLLSPEQFDVVAFTNLNGDYASDAVAAQVGGIGIAPGANLNYLTGHAIFEATHGTAPDIAGKNLANPCSLLLSGVMLLDYLGFDEAGAYITEAIEATIKDGQVTGDFARQIEGATQVGTTEFGALLVEHIMQ